MTDSSKNNKNGVGRLIGALELADAEAFCQRITQSIIVDFDSDNEGADHINEAVAPHASSLEKDEHISDGGIEELADNTIGLTDFVLLFGEELKEFAHENGLDEFQRDRLMRVFIKDLAGSMKDRENGVLHAWED